MDSLLLLNKGGKQVYFGPLGDNFETVLGYFSDLNLPAPEFQNPAEFIIETADQNGPKVQQAWQV